MSLAIRTVSSVYASIRHARRVEGRQIKTMAAASKTGEVATARAARYQFFRSREAKLMAAYKAWRRFGRRERLALVLGLAQRLNCWAACGEPVVVCYRPKASGGTRPIYQFGLEHTAMQMMVATALRASFVAPSWQFEHVGRGRDSAVQHILRVSATGYRYAACLDIASCFESFDREKACKVLVLPWEVTRHIVMPGNLATIRSFRFASRIGVPTDIPQLQQHGGLPQGSITSNLVASILLSDLAQFVSPSCELIGFRDDFVILGRTRSDVDENANSLREALLKHRSGRLELRKYQIADLRDGFDYLGYTILGDGVSTFAIPSASNIEKGEKGFRRAVVADVTARNIHPHNVELFLKRRMASFPNFSLAPFQMEHQLEHAQKVLDAYWAARS